MNGAIDAWINPNLGEDLAPERDVDYLFPHLRALKARGTTLDQLLEEMDAAGIDKAVLCAGYGPVDDVPWVNDAIEAHPDRLAGSIVVDPRQGMDAVRLAERLVRDHGYRLVRVLAFDAQLPYDHYAYFPLYSKCVELGVPIGVNVGIPGPKVPGKYQHPLALDEVCHFFPELRIVMSHGGDPWGELCAKLMLKWDNLYYMSSAFLPRYIPKPILNFMNTRGSHKVMFASDYPLLTLDRCMKDMEKVEFRDEETKQRFLRDNAEQLFFSQA